MKNIFSQSVNLQQNFACTSDTLFKTCQLFETNESVKSTYFDADHLEGAIEGKHYFIAFSIYPQADGCILEVQSTCKFRLTMPYTYGEGFIQFLQLQLGQN